MIGTFFNIVLVVFMGWAVFMGLPFLFHLWLNSPSEPAEVNEDKPKRFYYAANSYFRYEDEAELARIKLYYGLNEEWKG